MEKRSKKGFLKKKRPLKPLFGGGLFISSS